MSIAIWVYQITPFAVFRGITKRQSFGMNSYLSAGVFAGSQIELNQRQAITDRNNSDFGGRQSFFHFLDSVHDDEHKACRRGNPSDCCGDLNNHLVNSFGKSLVIGISEYTRPGLTTH